MGTEIKWIKLTTDMFDNRKIKYLRTLPEGNNIVLIWVMLLTMAGRCNAGGMIFLTENVPYNTKILADELGFDPNVVEVALKALNSMGMITVNDSEFFITNWEEYQNVDGMERIREQNRERQARFKERKKLGNVTDNVTVTLGNATDKEKDIDKEKENKSNKFTPPTVDEVSTYCKERNNNVDPNRFVDWYTARGWKGIKDWKACVRTWERRDKAEVKEEKTFDIKEYAKEQGWFD